MKWRRAADCSKGGFRQPETHDRQARVYPLSHFKDGVPIVPPPSRIRPHARIYITYLAITAQANIEVKFLIFVEKFNSSCRK